MARKRMVTRTIATTHASIKVYDSLTESVYNIAVQYSGELNENEVFKKARADEETEHIKVMFVDELEVEVARYGMDEGMFIELAQKLDKEKEEEA